MPQSKDNRLFLSKVHIKGFKSIEDLKVTFENGLNILIGKNASGKSNFLEYLFRSLGPLRLRSSIKYSKLELNSADDDVFFWETEREVQNVNSIVDNESRIILREKIFWNNKIIFDNQSQEKIIEYKKKKILSIGNARHLYSKLGFHINPLYIKFNLPNNLECLVVPGSLSISFLDDIDDWTHFTSLKFLGRLFLKIEMSYKSNLEEINKITERSFLNKLHFDEKIKDNLKKYSPIKDVRFNENINVYKTEKSISIENIRIDFKLNNTWIPWSQLSDGTKRLFYMICEITNQQEGFIFVDEPELGVHPHQFNLVMDFLKEESEDKQIIISTHSPQALNHLNENELSNILITSIDSKKGTQIKHLTTAQKNKAKKYMKEVGFFSDYWMLSDLD